MHLEKDLISVILPVFNAEKYIAQAIESVLSQTYSNIELIIINDGSTDDSEKICKEYEFDPRVKYYYQANKGLSASRQLGIDLCRGSYFSTIDADDCIADCFIEKLYSNILQKKSDICVCSWLNFKDNLKEFQVQPLRVNFDFFEITQDALRQNLKNIGIELTLSDSWNKLYRTEFVKQSGVKFELSSKYNGNDLAFNYKLLLHTPIYSIVNEPLLYHRITPTSMVRRKKRFLQEGFNCITDQVIQEMNIVHLSASSQISLFYYNLLVQAFWDKLNYSESLKECARDLCEYANIHSKYQVKKNFVPVKTSDFDSLNRLLVFLTQKNSKIGILCFGLFIKIKRKIIGRKK